MSHKEINDIMDKLDEIHRDVKKINEDKIPALDKRVAIVETKTKIWSGVAGVMGGCLVFLSEKLIGR
jgi:hypothetical protein